MKVKILYRVKTRIPRITRLWRKCSVFIWSLESWEWFSLDFMFVLRSIEQGAIIGLLLTASNALITCFNRRVYYLITRRKNGAWEPCTALLENIVNSNRIWPTLLILKARKISFILWIKTQNARKFDISSLQNFEINWVNIEMVHWNLFE